MSEYLQLLGFGLVSGFGRGFGRRSCTVGCGCWFLFGVCGCGCRFPLERLVGVLWWFEVWRCGGDNLTTAQQPRVSIPSPTGPATMYFIHGQEANESQSPPF